MGMNRKQIAAALEEISVLLELRGENPFKSRAFASAARAIETLERAPEELLEEGLLTSIRGIGKSTAEQIEALCRRGRSPLLDELRAVLPEELRRMLSIPGLGPKRLRAIHEALGVASLSDLEYAIHENRLRTLPGFGAKSEENLLRAVQAFHRGEGRFLLPAAWKAAEEVLSRDLAGTGRVEIAGELRRQLETISEVLFIVEIPVAGGAVPESPATESGVPCRTISVPAAAFDACWLWKSSAPAHREDLASRAAALGLSLGPGGFREGGEVRGATEEEIYEALGLPFFHPLLREGPVGDSTPPRTLAGPEAIHGVFHVHTTESDGTGTLEQMVAEAERLGYRWIGIADHSRSAFYANGLSEERLRAQRKAIDAIQGAHPAIRIFHGVESDILPDGSLDYSDEMLAELDFVVASIHSRMKMERRAMTDRIERALNHPATTHWGHPTGRLLLGREPYDCDLERLLRVSAEAGVSVEFNAHPQRLDLDWRWISRALALGIRISVNPDAHAPEGLADARLTVGTAAKGGLTPREMLNSLSAEEIAGWLASKRGRGGPGA